MKIKNVSNERVTTMTNGNVIVFEPHGEEGSIKDVWDPVFCKHILTKYRDSGIVHFEYNGEMQKRYSDKGGQQAFEKDQVTDAFKSMKRKWQDALLYEREAVKAYKEKGGTLHEFDNMDPSKFEKKIKDVEAQEKAFLAEYEPKIEKTEVRRGRPPMEKQAEA